MTSRQHRVITAAFLALSLPGLMASPAWAQKTDVVRLINGDTLTCEIKLLDRGRLEVSTDHLGTVSIEWDKVAAVTANRTFRVVTSSGLRLLGRLATSEASQLGVVQDTGLVSVDRLEVVYIVPIDRGFWRGLDGNVDLGLSYTKSSGIAQLNLDIGTTHRRPNGQVTASANSYVTVDDDGNDTSRHSLGLAAFRNARERWLWLLQGGFMSNQDLGYKLRSTVSGGVGHYAVRSNHSILAVGGGLSTSREVPLEGASTQQLEAMLSVRQSYFTYDRPKTDIALAADVYPSLSSWGRVRIEFEGRAKREIAKDFTIGFSMYDSFDSEPPTEEAHRNDIGLSFTIGWTF